MKELENYLDNLGEQKFQEENKIVVVHNPVVNKIIEQYEIWLAKERVRFGLCIDCYNHAKDLIKEIPFSAKDVKDFSFAMKNYEKEYSFGKSAYFLSASVNSSKETDFEIVTYHLNKKLDQLGFVNKKNIKISGDTGNYAGAHMLGGSLIVEGNASHMLGGDLHGGLLIVKGNAEGLFGLYTVDCLDNKDQKKMKCCFGENGGEIRVEGDLGARYLDDLFKAKVYVKNELVWPE
ncbi:MAG: hypothetical protein Q8P15_03420 [Nanoarchaeota archaeon]|nr:hypothetical protein [Nanoarchaeota archaeon]